MQASATTLETIWRLLKNLNIDLPYDPAIPLSGIYSKECDAGYSRGRGQGGVIAQTIYAHVNKLIKGIQKIIITDKDTEEGALIHCW
jgi:hypothetical protein